uniref:Uncharacterized protein n=1 Tax=Anguilla anguilla TaxID=7936 RepID=A0A0E9V120_ANGAN
MVRWHCACGYVYDLVHCMCVCASVCVCVCGLCMIR